MVALWQGAGYWPGLVALRQCVGYLFMDFQAPAKLAAAGRM